MDLSLLAGNFRNLVPITCCLILAQSSFSVVCAQDAGSKASGFPGTGHGADWSDAIPYYNRGNKYLEQGCYDQAVDDYNHAISIYPHDADFYVNLGYCYRKTEDFTLAEKAFRKALTINDKDWTTWSDLANSLLKQNRLKETISAFDRCLKCNPPAKEKEAILKDIADIKKVMSFQAPPPSAAPAAVIRHGGAVVSGKNAQAKGKSAAAKNAAAENKTSAIKKKPDESDWGYSQ